MAKRRLSMADEFPSKTEEFLDFVEGAAESQAESRLQDVSILATRNSSVVEQTVAITDIHLPQQQPRKYFSS